MPPVVAVLAAIKTTILLISVKTLVAVGLTKGFALFVASAAFSLATSVGLSFLAGALTPKPEQDAGSGIDQGSTLRLKFDPAYPREGMFGQAATGGSLAYATVSGTDNKYLWRVIPLVDHEIDSFVSMRGNSEVLTIFGDPTTGLRPVTSHFKKKDGTTSCLYVRIYKGTSAQTADTDLIAAAGGEWTTNCRGRGVAYAIVRMEYDADAFASGEPELTFELKGAKCYDPRTATTVWTENAALIAAQFARGIENNGVRIIGLGAASADIPDAELSDAADVCDEAVSLAAGGTEARYRIGGVISGMEPARSVLSDMIMSFGGLHVDRGGEIVFLPGQARTPVNAFGRALLDTDLLADVGISWVPDRPGDEICNVIHSTFVDKNAAWLEQPLPIRKDTAAITADGERFPKTRRYRFVTSRTQGERLNKMALSEARFQGRATFAAGLWALEYEPGDWETWTSPRFGGATKTFWVEQMEFAIDNGTMGGEPMARVNVSLVETDATVDDWSTADEAGVDGTVPARPSPALTLAGLALASVQVSEGGASMPELRATWTLVTHPAATQIEFEYRRTGDTVVYRSACDPGDTATQFRNGVYPKKIYQCRARVRTVDQIGAWSSWVSASVETGSLLGNKLPFNWVSTATDITIGDGSAEKTSGSAASWTAQVYSTTGYKGGAHASAQIANTGFSVAMGLNSDPTTNASYQSLDYCFLANTVFSDLQIWESNVQVLSLGAYAAGDTIDVSYDGYEVRYYWNGKLVRKTQATITAQLFFDSSFRDVGSKLEGIIFGKGPSAVGVSLDFDAVATTNMAVGKHVARKISGGASWNASIYSADGYIGGANASGSPAQANAAIMFGLNSDPTLDDDYTSIDYAWYLRANGAAEIYQSGVQVQTGWTYSAGDTFDVSYDGAVVVFYKNGRVCRSVQVSITTRLYFDSSFNTVNGELRGIAFRKGPSAFGEDLGFPNLYTETIALGRNSAKKATGTGAWDAQVCSLTGYVGGAHASASPAQTNLAVMFGLNTDPFTDAANTSIDYAWYLTNGGTASILESGVGVLALGAYAAGDTFQVSYDGRAVRYYKNGTLQYTRTASIAGALYFDSSFNQVGAQLDTIQFGRGALGGTNEVQPSQVNVNDNANMIQDPNFADAGYWTFYTGTSYSTDATNIGTQLSAAGGIVCALAGQPSGTIMGATTTQANWPIVEPGLWYRFRVNTRHSSGFTGVWAINYTWKTAAGVTIGAGAIAVNGVNYQTVAAGSAGNELLDSRAIQAPSNARFVDFAVIIGCSTTLPNAGTGWAAVPVLQKFVFGAGWQVTTGVSGYVTNINPLSAADIGATATITVAAFSIAYADANGTSRTTAYSAGSITLRAFSTLYYVFANDPGGAGGAVTYVAVTSTNGYADNVNYVYIGSVTTPANGAGGTSGGYQNNGCVAADAFVDDLRRASELSVGSVIDLLNYDGDGWGPGLIDDAYIVPKQQGVRLWTESGATLTCSTSTPITQQSGPDDYVLAVDALGAFVAVKDDKGFRWERIIQIDAVGEIDVTRVHCGGGTFAAGDEPGRMIFTHNAVKN